MAKKKSDVVEQNTSDESDFAVELIKQLNKEAGEKVAFNLGFDEAPTNVSSWISTGSKQLDYIIANKKDGGLPVGRIIEIWGPPSIGKSHIAAQICKSTYAAGGISVYIDTENATMVDNLRALGVNVSQRFVYIQTGCTEDVFKFSESTIKKAKAMSKDVPVTIIWDSVAASSPKAELEGDYDQNTIGLQARTIAKGMRKITDLIGHEKVLFVCLNQAKMKIGASKYEDQTAPAGGLAIPFHASVRIKLSSGNPLKDEKKEVYGINVIAKTIKNKVAIPFRSVNFEVHFGKGIREWEQIFDLLREYGTVESDDGTKRTISGAGGWKTFLVTKGSETILEKSFHKGDFREMMSDPVYSSHIDEMLEAALVRKMTGEPDIDHNSLVEIEALAEELGDLIPPE